MGGASIAVPFDTTMNPLALHTLTQFAAIWNGSTNGPPPGLTSSVASALSQATMQDLGTLGSWESMLGSIIDQAQAAQGLLTTMTTEGQVSRAMLSDTNLSSATRQFAQSQLLNQTGIQMLVHERQLAHQMGHFLASTE